MQVKMMEHDDVVVILITMTIYSAAACAAGLDGGHGQRHKAVTC